MYKKYVHGENKRKTLMKTHLKKMSGSIFDPEEAKRRSNGHSAGDGLRRGRNDQPQEVIATTMFETTLPGNILLNGVVEFGIKKRTLARMAAEYEAGEGKEPVKAKGVFLVNHCACRGNLKIDFEKKQATFSYTVS